MMLKKKIRELNDQEKLAQSAKVVDHGHLVCPGRGHRTATELFVSILPLSFVLSIKKIDGKNYK